mmetsp:Transcript_174426/g.559148  ORF Transcript_174426/g.559148 Transcript_174426/m.559148 type:complete len:298 (-) Transcript_174426:1290-2183(-)
MLASFSAMPAFKICAPTSASANKGKNSQRGTSRCRTTSQVHMSSQTCLARRSSQRQPSGRKKKISAARPVPLRSNRTACGRSKKRARCSTTSPARNRLLHSSVRSSILLTKSGVAGLVGSPEPPPLPLPPAPSLPVVSSPPKPPSQRFISGRKACTSLALRAHSGCKRTSSGTSLPCIKNCTNSFEKWLQLRLNTSYVFGLYSTYRSVRMNSISSSRVLSDPPKLRTRAGLPKGDSPKSDSKMTPPNQNSLPKTRTPVCHTPSKRRPPNNDGGTQRAMPWDKSYKASSTCTLSAPRT